MLKWNPDAKEARLLRISGVPGYLFSERDVSLDRLVTYTSTTEGLKPKRVTKEEQLEDLAEVEDDPLHNPYIMCICSEPNDLAAKVVAARVMLEIQRRREMAYWHTVIGGYRDDLRDDRKTYRRYDAIVLSNISANDSDLKIEKLRDILELYSDRPRIVTLTGQEPYSFFNAIGYPLNYSLWLRSVRLNRVL